MNWEVNGLPVFAASVLWMEDNLLACYQAPGIQDLLSGIPCVTGFSEPWTCFRGPDFGDEGTFLS